MTCLSHFDFIEVGVHFSTIFDPDMTSLEAGRVHGTNVLNIDRSTLLNVLTNVCCFISSRNLNNA